MDKRTLLFAVICVVLFVVFSVTDALLFAPQRKAAQEQQQQAADKDGEGERKDLADPDQPPADGTKEDEDAAAADGQPQTDEQPDQADDAPQPAATAAPVQWATLGRFDPSKVSNLLVVTNSQGATIERIEIVERTKNGRFRYRNLDDRSGYLGYLGLQDADTGGCFIRVVPPGTPAAVAKPKDAGVSAGLVAGDRLVRINKRQVQTRTDAGVALEALKPGSTAEVEVIRMVNGAEQPLTFTTVVSERPLAVIGSENIFSNGPGPNPGSFQMALRAAPSKTGAKLSINDPGLDQMSWELARHDEQLVEFRLRVPGDPAVGDMEYIKRYRLASTETSGGKSTGYHLQLEVEINNLGSQAQTVAYQLNGPNGLPTEGWWYLTKIHPRFFAVAGARDVVWSTANRGHQTRSTKEIYDQAVKKDDGEKPLLTANEPSQNRKLDYIGVDTQYFTVALLPAEFKKRKFLEVDEATPKAIDNVKNVARDRLKLTNTSFELFTSVTKIEPQKSQRDSYTIFAGPKDPHVLEVYNLQDVIYYGWFPWVAKPLAALLHAFYTIVGNYGLAIIMLTVLVRACMLPIGLKAARSAAMMQQMAPELKRIADKYKNDMEKRVQAQRELYAKYNFNPFGGCLLMFIQLPIFIGLYRCLAVDIHLRQAPLIPGIDWASNLAGPDMLWKWPLPQLLASETGWLGPYLNILPVMTIALFLVQQKLFTPPATDEQTRMQQQMIKFMMVFMGIMFFKVPSGLCIYFIASSIWGICERLMLPKPKPPTETTTVIDPRKTGGGGNGVPWRSKKKDKKK